MLFFISTKFSNLFVVSDNFISNIFALVTGRYKKLMASWGRGQYLIYSWGNKKKHRIETIFLGLPLALAVVTLQQRESQSRERWPAQRRGMSTASYSSHFSDPSNNAGLMASHPSHQTWKTTWETAICPRGWGWSSTTCGRGRKWRWDNEDIG